MSLISNGMAPQTTQKKQNRRGRQMDRDEEVLFDWDVEVLQAHTSPV